MNTLKSEYCLYVKRDSSEWHRMWKKLARHKLNRSLSEPTVADNDGEIWQYMSPGKPRQGCCPVNALSTISDIVRTLVAGAHI